MNLHNGELKRSNFTSKAVSNYHFRKIITGYILLKDSTFYLFE